MKPAERKGNKDDSSRSACLEERKGRTERCSRTLFSRLILEILLSSDKRLKSVINKQQSFKRENSVAFERLQNFRRGHRILSFSTGRAYVLFLLCLFPPVDSVPFFWFALFCRLLLWLSLVCKIKYSNAILLTGLFHCTGLLNS